MPPKKKTENLDDLKQELDIDYHKISNEELYQRFQTHPENVSFKCFFDWNCFVTVCSWVLGSQSCKSQGKSRT